MAEENTIQEEQQPTGIQFEDIVPWIDGSGDTGLSARLKLKRNFDKIKLLLEQQGAQQGGGVLTQPLTVNYKPNVGYLNGNAGITYNIGTPIETILRNILFQDMVADLSVSVSPSSPTAGTRVTLTATFTPGTTGKTVTGWQWFVDSSETAVEGATDRTFTPIETSGTHQYKVVATLSDGSTMMVTTNVTWQTRQASVTVTVSATEAEVGDTVTVTAAVALGSTATEVSAITCNGQAMSLSSGTTYTAQPQVQNGANEFEVEVTMNDGTVLTGNVSVTGYYKWFAGKVATEQASEVDITHLEADFIRTSPFSIPGFDITDWMAIAVAVPSDYTVTQIHAVTNGMVCDMLSDDRYMSFATISYRGKQYRIIDTFAKAPTDKSTINITMVYE